jgi:glutamate synthase domain-containing protein 3
MKIDALGLAFKELNGLIRRAVERGVTEIVLINVNGQRYIGAGISEEVDLIVHGVAGNDLGAFMDGPTIIVHGNGGDAIGNTMNKGRIVVHGNVGDVIGYSMRGGEIFIRGNAGYRVGVHMKEYLNNIPAIVVGGLVRDFLGEYMAGGRVIVLGLNVGNDEIIGDYIATGMHGGAIYIRGDVPATKLGVGAKITSTTKEDWRELRKIIDRYCSVFKIPLSLVLKNNFTKIVPISYRPYGKTYALK